MLNNQKQEIEKQKKYNKSDLFKNNNKYNEQIKNLSLIEYSNKNKWYMELINKIKCFFRK